MIDENNYLKHKTVCKSCYNKNRRKNTSIEKKIDKINNNNVSTYENLATYENHACVVIGPRNVGKTYYMLKILEKIANQRPIQVITRSPNQYPNYITSTEI